MLLPSLSQSLVAPILTRARTHTLTMSSDRLDLRQLKEESTTEAASPGEMDPPQQDIGNKGSSLFGLGRGKTKRSLNKTKGIPLSILVHSHVYDPYSYTHTCTSTCIAHVFCTHVPTHTRLHMHTWAIFSVATSNTHRDCLHWGQRCTYHMCFLCTT